MAVSEESFKTKMDEITQQLTKITECFVDTNKKIAESEQKVIKHINKKYEELNGKIVGLEAKVSSLQSESDAKSLRISALEMKLNMRNLIIFNFDESEITQEELVTNVVNFFNQTMKAIIRHSDVDQVYRLGKEQPQKSRPLFVSFVATRTRAQIFSLRRNLKNTKISISEDCPKDINAKRKELLPALLGARKMNKKAHFKLNTLVVNGVVCSENDIVMYKNANAESSKRLRPTDDSPSHSNVGQSKKHRNIAAAQRLGRQRSSSTSLDANTPISQFFESSPKPVPQGSQTVFHFEEA